MREVTVHELIGRGGFGEVHKVSDDSGAVFAQKTFSIHQNPNFSPELVENARRRFVREALQQAQMEHRNIVPVLDHDLDSYPPRFLMPLAESTLATDIARSRTLEGGFMEAMMDVIAGLEHIHRLGIYHRDLKPTNILRLEIDAAENEGGKSFSYAIGDFGLMSINDTQVSTLTPTGMQKGSDFYTAPEIVRDLRRATPQSDIFSLGCLLHEMVGSEERIPLQQIREEGPFAPIISVSTRRDPARRFADVISFRDSLLSVDVEALEAYSSEAAGFVELLDGENELSVSEWKRIIGFIDDQPDGAKDRHLLLARLSIDRINELISLSEDDARLLGFIYANWARENSFAFERCDGIANRLDVFIKHMGIEVIAECIMAMLYLGTDHNRWYVERKFLRLCSQDMNEDLARRIALEVRADGRRACGALAHLQRSISADLESLHVHIYSVFRSICQ